MVQTKQMQKPTILNAIISSTLLCLCSLAIPSSINAALAQFNSFLPDEEKLTNPTSTKFKAQIKELNKALAAKPNNVPLHLQRGFVHARLAHWDAAASDFARAHELDPKNIPSLEGQAWATYYNHKIAKAIKLMTDAIALDPRRGSLYEQRAEMREMLAEHEGAIADLDKALELGYINRLVYYQKAKSLYNFGRLEESLKVLDSGTDSKKPNLREAELRYSILINLGRYKEAYEQALYAVKISPKSGTAYEIKAECEIRLNKLKEASESLTKAISLHPERIKYYLRRSFVYNKLGDKAKAKADRDLVDKMSLNRVDL